MLDQIVKFNNAVLAYNNGFDIPVLDCYNENGEIGDNEDLIYINYNKWAKTIGSNQNLYSAPSQTLLQKWLREKHQIEVKVWAEYYPTGINWCVQSLQWDLTLDPKTTDLIKNGTFCFGDNGEFKTYEEALELGLEEALKMITNQHTQFNK